MVRKSQYPFWENLCFYILFTNAVPETDGLWVIAEFRRTPSTLLHYDSSYAACSPFNMGASTRIEGPAEVGHVLRGATGTDWVARGLTGQPLPSVPRKAPRRKRKGGRLKAAAPPAGLYLPRTFFTVASIFSAERPNSFSRSTAGPEWPNVSLTPILVTGVGHTSLR